MNIISGDVPVVPTLSYLPSISMIFSLVNVEQTGQPKVCDLHMVWVLHQNIAGSQISVDEPNLL